MGWGEPLRVPDVAGRDVSLKAEADRLRAERDEAVRLLERLVNSDDRFRAGEAAAFLASIKENP